MYCKSDLLNIIAFESNLSFNLSHLQMGSLGPTSIQLYHQIFSTNLSKASSRTIWWNGSDNTLFTLTGRPTQTRFLMISTVGEPESTFTASMSDNSPKLIELQVPHPSQIYGDSPRADFSNNGQVTTQKL
jgi:hypothetical protein